MTRGRAFDELSARGQVQRLRTLALEALRRYDVEIARCSFVARAFNTVFRVDATDGSRHAIRLSPSVRIHADGCEVAETAWLAALETEPGIRVPRVTRAADGSAVVWASAPDVPRARSCVLFEWMPGRRLRDDIRAERVHELGALTAALHRHGAGYATDRPAGVLVADRVCYFRQPSRLGDLQATYGSVIDEATVRAQSTLDQLWTDPPHPPHVLHGDLQPGNVIVRRGSLSLVDFQDLIWGFEVQDLAIALVALKHQGDPGEWGVAFRAGYESVRRWPDADPDTWAALRAARHLNELDYRLQLGRPGLDDALLARQVALIAAWMRA